MTPSSIRAVASATAALVLAAALTVLVAAPAAAEPTGGCRPVGGGPVSTAGPHRATVVVDPGSGAVWSACITFQGTVTGLEALQLAATSIDGLSPVLEPYAGQGAAVCRLLGVGNTPPNCMSKTVEYWAYFRNGAYARGGGSNTVVRDGDVEGWSFGRGTPPRPATAGTEAVGVSALPTTTTTAPSPPATTAPRPDITVPEGDGAAPPDPGTDPAAGPGPGSVPPESGTAESGPHEEPDTPLPGDDPDGGAPDGDDTEVAAGAAGGVGPEPDPPGTDEAAGSGATVTLSQSDDGDGSSVTSMVGFGGALGVAGVALVVVRRRRRSATYPSGPAPTPTS